MEKVIKTSPKLCREVVWIQLRKVAARVLEARDRKVMGGKTKVTQDVRCLLLGQSGGRAGAKGSCRSGQSDNVSDYSRSLTPRRYAV